jgi:hypothetical protein
MAEIRRRDFECAALAVVELGEAAADAGAPANIGAALSRRPCAQ